MQSTRWRKFWVLRTNFICSSNRKWWMSVFGQGPKRAEILGQASFYKTNNIQKYVSRTVWMYYKHLPWIRLRMFNRRVFVSGHLYKRNRLEKQFSERSCGTWTETRGKKNNISPYLTTNNYWPTCEYTFDDILLG